MKSSIVYVFKIIISLVVTGVLWMLIIGHLDTDPDVVGEATVFRRFLWQSASDSYTETFARESDDNGKGFDIRTQNTWNNSAPASLTTTVSIDLRTK